MFAAPVSGLFETRLECHLVGHCRCKRGTPDLGTEFVGFQEEGQVVGKQYLADTGPLDILAVSKDGKLLLVIELKRARPLM